ncbi:MAG TPA: hypothetical protein V6D10_00215 [Trichocoleus sp.]
MKGFLTLKLSLSTIRWIVLQPTLTPVFCSKRSRSSLNVAFAHRPIPLIPAIALHSVWWGFVECELLPQRFRFLNTV